jgi:hypothetical protein
MRMVGGVFGHHTVGVIGRAAIDDQDFEPVGRIILGQYRLQAGANVIPFVAHWDEDGDDGT